MIRAFVTVLLPISVFGACVEELPDESSTPQAVVIDNRLAANRLAANRLAANRLAANRLAANRLAANRLAANQLGADELLATDEGREVLAFIVSCALNEGTTLVAENEDGDTFEFLGELGLAPQWLHHPLDEQGTGWVSACLFARVNANNVAVPVSMRGRHSQLKKVDGAEAAGWSLEEGAFYGNFLVDRGDGYPDWYACRGRDQAAGETGGLISRDCTESDPANPGFTICGFTDAGDCGDYDTPPNPTACDQLTRAHKIGNDRVKGGYYEDCYAEPRLDKKKHAGSSAEFREVITAYVIP